MASALRQLGLGMNYGVVPAFITPLPTATVQADLNDMWRDGIRSIRMWLYNPQTSPSAAITNTFLIADMAKAMGFSVSFGVTCLGTTLSDANWTAISAAVVAQATAAQARAIPYDEFIIDNEAYGRISGLTNFFTKYAALATAVKAVFSGIVSYNESENNITNWVGQTIGSGGTVPVDQFGLNTYGSANTEAGWRYFLLNAQICFGQFGTKSYVSEFNLNASNPYAGLSERQIHEGSKFRVDKILDPALGIGFTKAFWFSYTSPSDQFAVKKADGTFHRNRYAFTKIRRISSEIVT